MPKIRLTHESFQDLPEPLRDAILDHHHERRRRNFSGRSLWCSSTSSAIRFWNTFSRKKQAAFVKETEDRLHAEAIACYRVWEKITEGRADG